MFNRRKINGLILAAGLSTRMGEFKPLLQFRGKTMIENTIDNMISGGVHKIVVVVGYRGKEIEDILLRRYKDKVTITYNYDYYKTDMMHSIQIGCRIMPKCDIFFILPGDMPVVRENTFKRLIKKYPKGGRNIVFPTLDGFRKHPPLIDFRLINEILMFREDGGLRCLWQKHKEMIIDVPVDDKGVWVDIDTPGDYQLCKMKYENI